MGKTYGYTPQRYALITLFTSGTPDFKAAEKLIRQGADVNDQGDDKYENMLSEILLGYWLSGIDDGFRPVSFLLETMDADVEQSHV